MPRSIMPKNLTRLLLIAAILIVVVNILAFGSVAVSYALNGGVYHASLASNALFFSAVVVASALAWMICSILFRAFFNTFKD